MNFVRRPLIQENTVQHPYVVNIADLFVTCAVYMEQKKF